MRERERERERERVVHLLGFWNYQFYHIHIYIVLCSCISLYIVENRIGSVWVYAEKKTQVHTHKKTAKTKQ